MLAVALALLPLAACKPKYNKYESTFMELFNTYSIIVGYAKTESEFDGYANVIYNRIKDLHEKYDIYNEYDGVNNIKTINDMAGIEAVPVSEDIISMLKFGKQAYIDTDGTVNIAMGAVLRIWHDYRTEGIEDPQNAKLPPMEELKAAAALTDINDLVIDEAAGTVYLTRRGMSLDVGAIAKGFAVQLATNEAKQAGMTSALVNIGGNICSVGKPFDGVRARWGVGVQTPKPEADIGQDIIDTVFVNDTSVVTSGNYQRYYVVAGKAYNHIIDKDTLMPANRFDSVTVVCGDSATADMLSTCLYVLPEEKGRAVLSKIGGEAIWVYHDGTVQATEGYIKISKTLGGYSAVD